LTRALRRANFCVDHYINRGDRMSDHGVHRVRSGAEDLRHGYDTTVRSPHAALLEELVEP
jgi:hypothetical protein